MIGSGFRCWTDAFDSSLSCHSDCIAENHLNVLEKTKTLDEKHIVSSDYSPKTAKILGRDIVAFKSTSTCSIVLLKISKKSGRKHHFFRKKKRHGGAMGL